jgi:hypothetical protein
MKRQRLRAGNPDAITLTARNQATQVTAYAASPCASHNSIRLAIVPALSLCVPPPASPTLRHDQGNVITLLVRREPAHFRHNCIQQAL